MAFVPVSSGLAGALAQNQPQPYTDPEVIARKQRLAELLRRSGMSGQPQTPIEGVGKLAQVLSGAFIERKANKGLEENAAARHQTLQQVLAAQDPSVQAMLLARSPDQSLQGLGVERGFGLGDESRKAAREDERYTRALTDKRADTETDREYSTSQARELRAFQEREAQRDRENALRVAGVRSGGFGGVPPSTGASDEDTPPEYTGETIWDITPQAVGVGNTINDISNRTVAQLPNSPFFDEKTANARSRFKLIERNLIRSFSINNRYPVAEQKRILNLVPQAEALQSVPNARAALRQIDQALAGQIEQDISLLRTGGLEKKDYSELLQRAQMMASLRDEIGVPQSDAQPQREGAPQAIEISGDDEYERLPSGSLFIGPDGRTRRKP